MAVQVKCANASALLAKIEAYLVDPGSNTWAINAKREITHTPEQWRGQAYFTGQSNAENDRIIFAFSMAKTPPAGLTPKTRAQAYPYYHGRLVSFLFDHFHGQFEFVAGTNDNPPVAAPTSKTR